MKYTLMCCYRRNDTGPNLMTFYGSLNTESRCSRTRDEGGARTLQWKILLYMVALTTCISCKGYKSNLRKRPYLILVMSAVTPSMTNTVTPGTYVFI